MFCASVLTFASQRTFSPDIELGISTYNDPVAYYVLRHIRTDYIYRPVKTVILPETFAIDIIILANAYIIDNRFTFTRNRSKIVIALIESSVQNTHLGVIKKF